MKKSIIAAVAGITLAAIGMGTAAEAAGAKIFVIGGKPDDPFWGIVKRGAEDAAKVVGLSQENLGGQGNGEAIDQGTEQTPQE